MFTTLPESRAIRTRSARSTMASVVLHGALIAGAVAATLPNRGDARPEPMRDKKIIYVPIDPEPRRPTEPMHPRSRPTQPSAPLPTIAAPSFTPKTLPPIDINAPEIPPDQIIIGAPGSRTGPPAATGPSVFVPGSVVDVAAVDRIPRIIGTAPAPRYPNSLRESGITGQVVVRFVVDTLGRAELDGVVIQETTHALFADAVKNVLGFYRFSPGEAGGHRVRTLVQVPCSFSLR